MGAGRARQNGLFCLLSNAVKTKCDPCMLPQERHKSVIMPVCKVVGVLQTLKKWAKGQLG